jgi:probable rRNA maturation factor
MHSSLLIEDDKWLSALGSDAEALVERVVSLTLSRTPELDDLLSGERMQLGLSVVLTNDSAIQELNKQFRTKDLPTNVLSFPAYDSVDELRNALAAPISDPMLEDSGYLGDLILARETILREAMEQEKKLKDHFCHLLVHGTLHLLGYDHMENDEADEMEALEIDILKELSIANPYE